MVVVLCYDSLSKLVKSFKLIILVPTIFYNRLFGSCYSRTRYIAQCKLYFRFMFSNVFFYDFAFFIVKVSCVFKVEWFSNTTWFSLYRDYYCFLMSLQIGSELLAIMVWKNCFFGCFVVEEGMVGERNTRLLT